MTPLERTLNRIILIGGAFGVIASLTGVLIIMPQRLDAAEKRIEVLANQMSKDKETLVRIEERLIAIQKQMEKKI